MASSICHICRVLVLPLTIALLIARAVATDFSVCKQIFNDGIESGNSTVTQYLFNKTPQGLLDGHKPPRLLTYAGCEVLCGVAPDFYDWNVTSNTITTWVLPLAGGLILQLPYEANQRYYTFLTLCRWLGSPIVSLAYILWNIKVTNKCALMVDMAVPRDSLPEYDRRSAGEWWNTAWNHFLSPFVVQAEEENPKDPPQNVDFADFRNSMYLLAVLNQYTLDYQILNELITKLVHYALFTRDASIVTRRNKLAASIRKDRRHSVVQVMLSLFWFIVALVISIYNAFFALGDNATAHNLALGLLMSWLPALVASSLVDRNPTNAAFVKSKFERFFEHARDRHNQTISGQSINFNPGANVIRRFSGQARSRWHYGIAHSILQEFERSLQPGANRRRDMLQYYRDGTLQHQITTTPWKFDPIEIWQFVLAGGAVTFAAFGAFTISFNTPTVGLGCRSGGYMIYGVLAAFGCILDFIGWAADKPTISSPSLKRKFAIVGLRILLVILEVTNAAWLVYIILAQTFGVYNACRCKSSVWSYGKGGYMDFAGTSVYSEDYQIRTWWPVGTALGMLPFLLVFYVVWEWCVQSFLWTEDYQKAMRGLRRVRFFKGNHIGYPILRTMQWLFVEMPYEGFFKRPYLGIMWAH